MNNEKDNKFLKVNINSLQAVNSELKIHNDNIVNSLMLLSREFNKIEEYFNTKTGKEYQELTNKCINETIDYISSKNNYLLNKLNDIQNIYWDLYGDIEKNIGEDNMENNNG